MKNFLKSDKFYYSTSLFVISFFFIIVGFILIIGNKNIYFNIMNIFISIIFLLGIFQFFLYVFSKNENKHVTFIKSFSYLLFAIIINFFRKIPLSFFPLLFSLYMILNGMIRFITFFLLLKSKNNGKVFNFIAAILFFFIGIPLLFKPLKNISTMLLFVGIYTLLLGVSYFISFVNNILSMKNKHRIRITLPSLISFIIPYQVLKEINSYINNSSNKINIIDEKKIDDVPNLEIFIHVAPSSYNRFGHVDICMNGIITSYGAYDFSTSKLFNMIGDGMIFQVSRENYINYCTKYSNKTLFCFGLKIDSKQIDSISNRLNNVLNNCIAFDSLYERDIINNKRRKKYNDYPSNLVRKSKAKFYKIKSGKFKTFFILGVNCCKFVDFMLGKSITDVLKMVGIITPGTYYDYLNQEFYKKNSIVISRTIYNNLRKKK